MNDKELIEKLKQEILEKDQIIKDLNHKLDEIRKHPPIKKTSKMWGVRGWGTKWGW